MAIFRSSGLVESISGKAGGVEFVNARGAGYVRRAQHKDKRVSPSALNAKSVYRNALEAWRGLTPAERLEWEAITPLISSQNRLGLPRTLPTNQLYLQVAIPTFRVHGAFPGGPSSDWTSPPLTGFDIVAASPASVDARFFSDASVSKVGVEVYAGWFINKRTPPRPRNLRLVYAGDTDSSGEVDLVATWPEDFAPPAGGWTIYAIGRRVAQDAVPSQGLAYSVVVPP